MENTAQLRTVRVVWAGIDPETAAIVVLPAFRPVASPVEVMVATVVLLEDQVTVVVRFRVVPSENVPVAVY